MHLLIGLGILAGLIAFVFGEGAARAFVGFVLTCMFGFAMFVAYFIIQGLQ